MHPSFHVHNVYAGHMSVWRTREAYEAYLVFACMLCTTCIFKLTHTSVMCDAHHRRTIGPPQDYAGALRWAVQAFTSGADSRLVLGAYVVFHRFMHVVHTAHIWSCKSFRMISRRDTWYSIA